MGQSERFDRRACTLVCHGYGFFVSRFARPCDDASNVTSLAAVRSVREALGASRFCVVAHVPATPGRHTEPDLTRQGSKFFFQNFFIFLKKLFFVVIFKFFFFFMFSSMTIQSGENSTRWKCDVVVVVVVAACRRLRETTRN